MRGVPSTCGMIFKRKFGASSDALIGDEVGGAVLVAHRAGRDADRP